MAPTAAFFDLDKTIIAKSSTLAFSKPFQAGGLISRRAVLRSAYAQFVYLVGGADHDQMEKLRQFMSQLVAGWDVATVREIVAETLHHVVDPIVYDEAVSLIAEHQLAGRDVVIVSASGTEVVEPIGALLGADHVVASRLRSSTASTPAGSTTTPTPRRRRARSRASPRSAATTSPVLRLQRLRDRRPDARGRRATRTRSTPTRTCAGRPPPAAGRCWSSSSRSRCAAGCRCPRPGPPSRPSPSAARSPSAASWGQLAPASPRRLTWRTDDEQPYPAGVRGHARPVPRRPWWLSQCGRRTGSAWALR